MGKPGASDGVGLFCFNVNGSLARSFLMGHGFSRIGTEVGRIFLVNRVSLLAWSPINENATLFEVGFLG